MAALESILRSINKRLAIDAQLGDIDVRAKNVEGYRQYYNGEHVLQLTNDQRSMLRIIDRGFGTQGFNANYMGRVVDTKANRLVLEKIESDNDAITTLLAELVKDMKLDRVSGEVHSHTPRDGDNFVMVSFDNTKKLPRLTEELAYDGNTGVIPVYRSSVDPVMYAAIKVWIEYNLNELEGDTYTPFTRVNVYFADRIEKYISRNGATVEKFYDTDENGIKSSWPIQWVDDSGLPLGIPIFHFRWNGEQNYGKSVLDDVIAVQDGYNRILNSLVMASELTAFRLLAAFGFTPPSAMTPGGWVVVGGNGLDKDDVVKIEQIAAGDLKSLLEAAKYFKNEIHDSSNTPNPAGVDSGASGEARKQYESFLIGELEKAQSQLGETWESVFEMVLKLLKRFGGQSVPVFKRLYARWKDAEIRDSAVLMANAALVRPDISRNTYLQTVASVFEWDQAKIDQIIAEKEEDDKANMKMMQEATPGFGNSGGIDSTDPNQDSGSSNNL